VNLVQFLNILWARRNIILAAIAACFLTALAISQIVPPRYVGSARVMMEIVKPDPVTGELISGQVMRGYIATQQQLVKGYETAVRVVRQLGWATNPAFVNDYQSETGGRGVDIESWLAKRIIDSTEAKLVEGSNILEIDYKATDPEVARAVAGMIRTAYIESSVDDRRTSAQRTLAWYRDQTDRAKAALEAAEAERTKFAKENGIVLQPGNIDLETSKLQQLSSAAAAAQATPTFSAGPAIASPSAAQLDAINQQISQAANTLGPNHPTYQALLRQKSVIEAQVAREGAISGPRVVGGNAEGAFEAQKARVIAQSAELDKLAQMQRQIELRREEYLKYAQRASELRLESDIGETNLEPLGEPIAPDQPEFPNMPLIIFGSLALGAALGVLIALMVELLNRRVRSEADLETAVGAPVLAVVGVPAPAKPGIASALVARLRRRAANDQTDVEAA